MPDEMIKLNDWPPQFRTTGGSEFWCEFPARKKDVQAQGTLRDARMNSAPPRSSKGHVKQAARNAGCGATASVLLGRLSPAGELRDRAEHSIEDARTARTLNDR